MSNPNNNPIDPCDCFSLQHHNSMQRLLEMLRDGQSLCTDIECLNQELPNHSQWLSPTTALFLIFWVLLMSVMFLFWTTKSKANISADKNQQPKHDRDDQDNNNRSTPNVG